MKAIGGENEALRKAQQKAYLKKKAWTWVISNEAGRKIAHEK
jgi:hypothetical protein